MVAVVILGAGVVGVTAAYELAKDGHEVTVIDRQSGPGLETSFANGGQISANHATPWATPEALKKAIRWFGREDSPLVIRPRWDPALLSWMMTFLSNCRSSRVAINTERALRVALYSRDQLAKLRAELSLAYDQQRAGILHLYQSPKDMEAALGQAEAMTALGCRRDVLDRDAVLQLEPSLRGSLDRIIGGIFSPDDESGDAWQFTQAMTEAAKALGVAFQFSRTITGFDTEANRIRAVRTDHGPVKADQFILSLGSYSAPIGRMLGLKLPVYPAKGYSVTFEVTAEDMAPRIALIDDDNKIVFSRLGQRLRVAGTAEFTGYDLSENPKRSGFIKARALRLFPGLDDGREAEPWCGLRPMTPDQVPILGQSPFDNLVFNTGHGTLGWTMAAGSARIVADLVAGREPAIALTGLGLDRFD